MRPDDPHTLAAHAADVNSWLPALAGSARCRILPPEGGSHEQFVDARADASASLYACLRTPAMPDLAMAIARDFSPRVQRRGQACVVLDVSGLGRLLGPPAAVGAELERAAAERSFCRAPRDRSSNRIAIAPTQIAALLLSLAPLTLEDHDSGRSSQPPAATIVTGDVASALADVPLAVLHGFLAERYSVAVPRTTRRKATARESTIWASYEQAFDTFGRWGLRTLGDVAALPPGELSARVGQHGIALQRSARGMDEGPLVPDGDVPRFLEHVSLEWPIDGLEPLSFVLARMLDPLSAALERADRGAVAIRVALRLIDRSTHTRLLQLPAAMRDARVLRTLVVLDLESHPPSAAIDDITIEIDPAPARVLQYSLLERARPSAETLATLIARLGALVGESRCGAAVLQDSHGPDAFDMQRFAPDERHTWRPADIVASASMGPEHAVIDAASVIDCVMLRRFRPPIAVRVAVERGRPVRVAIDRRGMPGGVVEQCAGPWRSSGVWWADSARQSPSLAGFAARSWDRDEWDVALSDGSVCRLWQERANGHWFLDGVLD
jgi:protein ImuB